jgi:formylglycine-generating enzyme required for sulfatase activity
VKSMTEPTPQNSTQDNPPSAGVNIDSVGGNIEGSKLVGRDNIEIGIQIIQQSGRPAPPETNLAAQLAALQQTLAQVTHPAEVRPLQRAIETLAQALAALPGHERAYLERVEQRFAKPAVVFVELAADTVEKVGQLEGELDLAALADWLGRSEMMPRLDELQTRGPELKRIALKSLGEGAEKYPCLIVLGEPGSGKTTALNQLAYQLSREALSAGGSGPTGQLPLPLRLSEFGPEQSVAAFIGRSWRGSLAGNHWAAPELAANLEGYLEQGRLLILFDGLNEMPAQGYVQRAAALRDFIERWQATGNRFIVTCRVLDYGEELQGLQRVEVRPFSHDQIQAFLQKVLAQHWAGMWAALTQGSDAGHRLLQMAGNPYVLTLMVGEFVRRRGQLSRNRAELMTNFTDNLWQRARAKCPPAEWLDAAIQREALSVLAFEAQARAGFGTMVTTEQVKAVMPPQVQPDPRWPPLPAPPDQVLTLAASANIIEMPVDRSTVRFYHQLLQEYFAARDLLKRGKPDLSGFQNLTGLWTWPWLESEMPPVEPAEDSWEPLPPPPPTGWEETTIMAAGLMPENDDQLLRALLAINPVLAGRCLHEGQAKVDGTVKQQVVEALLETIARPEVALRVRIAAGEVLGDLGDPRLGQMVAIPAGKFRLGDDKGGNREKPRHELFLPDYQIGQYPLTNAEYAPFIEAGGYQDQRWWTEAGWATKDNPNLREGIVKEWLEALNLELTAEQKTEVIEAYVGKGSWSEPRYWRDSRFNKPNQPVVGVSWYEAVAYCRWRSAESGQTFRLPNEVEWEKAARGADGRAYPWGNRFDPGRLNANEGKQIVRTTTPVGIYLTGASPFGVYDCAGNVWEWCATKTGGDFRNPEFKAYPYDVAEDEWSEAYLAGTNVRVLRGGSWSFVHDFVRCAARDRIGPILRFFEVGFRLLLAPI